MFLTRSGKDKSMITSWHLVRMCIIYRHSALIFNRLFTTITGLYDGSSLGNCGSGFKKTWTRSSLKQSQPKIDFSLKEIFLLDDTERFLVCCFSFSFKVHGLMHTECSDIAGGMVFPRDEKIKHPYFVSYFLQCK
jgi:hypothetical protein